MALRTFFSASKINRQSWLRADSKIMAKLILADSARFVAIWQSRCLIDGERPAFLKRNEIEKVANPNDAIYLGKLGKLEIFAVNLPTDLNESTAQLRAAASFTSLLGELDPDSAALLAHAKGIIEWRQRHLYCGLCGNVNYVVDAGNTLECSASDCRNRCFPRLDPAIIVLAQKNDRCLLGRQTNWPTGRFSTLAGFVEPGEALEDAVSREIFEETSVRIESCEYLGSQPWPFPSSLMIGFHAFALSEEIRLIDGELAEARWFSRNDIAAGCVKLPPPTSIAYRLIEAWFDQAPGHRLADLDVSSQFSSSRG